MTTKREVKEKFQDIPYPISVMGRNVEVTEAMKNYALEKIMWKLQHYHSRVIDVHVVMDVQRGVQAVDFLVTFNNLRMIVRGRDKDMYAAIDQAVHHLESRITRYLKRIHNHHLLPFKEIEMSSIDSIDLLTDINDQIEEETLRKEQEHYQPPSIVEKEERVLAILNEKEVLARMLKSRDPFLVFRSEEDMVIKLVVRLPDGNFSIVIPK